MKPTKQYTHIDNILHSAREPEHQNTDDHTSDASSIAEICSAIANLVTAVSEASGKQEPQTGFSDLTEGQSDALWDSVCDFAARLARARSSSLDDISGKISIWRHLAPEQGEMDNHQTIDETLLFSIIDDVERLRAQQRYL